MSAGKVSARASAAAIVLGTLLAAAGARGEPLTPQRVVEEIRWQDSYTVEEVKMLVFSVASMYQDELDRAVRAATRPLLVELEELRAGRSAEPGGRLTPGGEAGRRGTAAAGKPAGKPAGPGAGSAERSPAAGGADLGTEIGREARGTERELRVWRVIGISAIAVGLLEAAVLLGR